MVLNLALFIAIAGQDPAPDTVRILDSDVPITFPSSKQISNDNPHVEVGNWNWNVSKSGIGKRYLKDGAWGDIKELYAKSKDVKNAKQLPIRVMIVQNASQLLKSSAGVVRQVWKTIDEAEIETIKKSLATLGGTIRAVTGGSFEAKFEVTVERETYFTGFQSLSRASSPTVLTSPLTLSESSADPMRELIQSYIAPQFNNERFDTDDGQNHGPFSAVILIHPGIRLADQITMVNDTPLATLHYYDFSDESTSSALPKSLVQIWQKTLVASAVKRGFPLHLTEGSFVFGGPYWTALADRSLRQTALERTMLSFKLDEPKILPRFPNRVTPLSVPNDSLVQTSPASTDRTLVSFDKLDYLQVTLDKAKSPSVTGLYANPYGELWAELDIKNDSIESAFAIESRINVPNEIGDKLQVVGDFSVAPKTGADNRSGFEIRFLKPETRGHVLIASGEPIIKKGQKGFLSFDLTLSEGENVKLILKSASGQTIDELALGGDMETRAEGNPKFPFDARVPADNQPHSSAISLDQLSLTEDITEVWVTGGEDRISRGDTAIVITGLRFDTTTNVTSPIVPVDPALSISKIEGQATAEQTQQLIQAIKSNSITLKLTALDVLSRTKSSGSVSACQDAARSGFASVAFLAMNALEFQDVPEGWATIREIVERGPFDHNRRFAALQLEKKPDPGMAASLNMLSTKSWIARMAGVRALIAINSPSAQLIMSNLLGSEPNASVRLLITRSLDATNPMIGRKLLYTAVNDASQWVRSIAYARLLDSRDPKTFEEALKGVRDEAVDVRLYLLDQMRVQAKSTFRPALQMALGDPNPTVRAACVRAYMTQPGGVSPTELQSVLSDTDPDVKQALQELATKKGWK